MTPQRRTALVSIGAAGALVALKLGTGLASGSLGLVTEALHSGTDLVAALLTFFAIGVAVRPADEAHQYGHGKAEHLAALAEATVLALVSVRWRLSPSLASSGGSRRGRHFLVGLRGRRARSGDRSYAPLSRYGRPALPSEALLSNAIHFGSDFAGTLAVLGGLVAARAGFPGGDSIAALFVAALVLMAAGRLIRRNVDVLMDRAPADAEEAARAAIARIDPPVELSRLRLRQAAGRTFADVVISVPPGSAVGQGHAIADRVEAELERALPGATSSSTSSRRARGGSARARSRCCAERAARAGDPQPERRLARRGHRLVAPPQAARRPDTRRGARARGGSRAGHSRRRPEIDSVQTHLEPLAEAEAGAVVEAAELEAAVERAAGGPPRELRLMRTEKGVVAFLTLGLDPDSTLAEAHARASEVEERLRRARPDVADVIVHTEP